MYRKMRESGLTEIIPFKCLSAIWGQRPVFFSHLSGPQCSVRRGCSSIAVRQQTFFFLGTLHTQKFTFGGPESLMVVTSLFIDTAGNTPFLSWDFPRVLEVKNSPASAGDGGSILDPGRSHMPQGN